MKSITSMKASVISRLASFLQFTTNPKRISDIANTRAIGDVSATQTSQGVFYPTVQSAIDDLVGRCDLPVNTVITNTDGVIPGFTSQVDQFKFTGTLLGDVSSGPGTPTPDGTPYTIYVLGFPVLVASGDSALAVAAKTQVVLQEAVIKNIALSKVEIDAVDATVLNITYNDYQTHVFAPTTERGIKIVQTTTVQPRAGYGSWDQMGTQVVTLAGGSVNGPVTLYYFKRVS